MELSSHLWLGREDEAYFGKGRIELLSRIDELGSITRAAKAMRMSYKAAWEAVNAMNAQSPAPIVERVSGGKGGGGTSLTDRGRELIAIYRRVEAAQWEFFAALGHYTDDIDSLRAFTAKSTVRTSARNQLATTVVTIDMTHAGVDVTVRLSWGETMQARITRQSLEELAIEAGTQVWVLFKPSWVFLDVDKTPSALHGIVRKVDRDISEVVIGTESGDEIVASLNKMHFQTGEKIRFQVDPSAVLLAV